MMRGGCWARGAERGGGAASRLGPSVSPSIDSRSSCCVPRPRSPRRRSVRKERQVRKSCHAMTRKRREATPRGSEMPDKESSPRSRSAPRRRDEDEIGRVSREAKPHHHRGGQSVAVQVRDDRAEAERLRRAARGGASRLIPSLWTSVEITTLTRQLNAAIEEVTQVQVQDVEERLARRRGPFQVHGATRRRGLQAQVEKRLEALRLEMQKESEKLTQQLMTARQDADEWKSRNSPSRSVCNKRSPRLPRRKLASRSRWMARSARRRPSRRTRAPPRSRFRGGRHGSSRVWLTDAVVSYAEKSRIFARS